MKLENASKNEKFFIKIKRKWLKMG